MKLIYETTMGKWRANWILDTESVESGYLDDQEISMLSLHLLQISMVYINTLMIQDMLKDEVWLKRLTKEDYRGLTPLFYGHVEPYGTIQLDMTRRLALA